MANKRIQQIEGGGQLKNRPVTDLMCILRSSSYSWKVLMTASRDESGVVLNPGDEVLAVGVSSRSVSSLCHDCLNITREHTNAWEVFCFRTMSIRLSWHCCNFENLIFIAIKITITKIIITMSSICTITVAGLLISRSKLNRGKSSTSPFTTSGI